MRQKISLIVLALIYGQNICGSVDQRQVLAPVQSNSSVIAGRASSGELGIKVAAAVDEVLGDGCCNTAASICCDNVAFVQSEKNTDFSVVPALANPWAPIVSEVIDQAGQATVNGVQIGLWHNVADAFKQEKLCLKAREEELQSQLSNQLSSPAFNRDNFELLQDLDCKLLSIASQIADVSAQEYHRIVLRAFNAAGLTGLTDNFLDYRKQMRIRCDHAKSLVMQFNNSTLVSVQERYHEVFAACERLKSDMCLLEEPLSISQGTVTVDLCRQLFKMNYEIYRLEQIMFLLESIIRKKTFELKAEELKQVASSGANAQLKDQANTFIASIDEFPELVSVSSSMSIADIQKYIAENLQYRAMLKQQADVNFTSAIMEVNQAFACAELSQSMVRCDCHRAILQAIEEKCKISSIVQKKFSGSAITEKINSLFNKQNLNTLYQQAIESIKSIGTIEGLCEMQKQMNEKINELSLSFMMREINLLNCDRHTVKERLDDVMKVSRDMLVKKFIMILSTHKKLMMSLKSDLSSASTSVAGGGAAAQ